MDRFMHGEDKWAELEILQAAHEAYMIQGNIEDALYLLEDHMDGDELDIAEAYLEERYGNA